MTITFNKPPIIEFSLGAQFAPLARLTNGHFGLFWRELGGEWTVPSDEPPIQDQFELFDAPKAKLPPGVRLSFGPAPHVGRFTLTNQTRDRVLHFQPTRFMLSWRRTEKMKPSYKTLIDEYLSAFEQFEQFVESSGVGPLQLNQWEITYVDSFAKGVDWESVEDWSSILPGLFGSLFDADELGMSLERRFAQWHFEIAPRKGRLHVVGQLGKLSGDTEDSLILTTTARGPIGNNSTQAMRDGLDLGHEKSVAAFLKIVNPSLQQKWEPQL
jgi:uncharacterized protein (TIGR04255 family)